MKFTTILAAAALTMTVSAKSPLPPSRPLLQGTVNSDRDCREKLAEWTLDENVHDRCIVFDEEIEGVEDYAVKSLRIDALNNPNCGGKMAALRCLQSLAALLILSTVWIYSDRGCHMAARRVEPKTCAVADRWGWRSYAIFCL